VPCVNALGHLEVNACGLSASGCAYSKVLGPADDLQSAAQSGRNDKEPDEDKDQGSDENDDCADDDAPEGGACGDTGPSAEQEPETEIPYDVKDHSLGGAEPMQEDPEPVSPDNTLCEIQPADASVTVDPMIPWRADEMDVDARRGRRLVDEAPKSTRAETASSASEAGQPTKRVVQKYHYRVAEEDLGIGSARKRGAEVDEEEDYNDGAAGMATDFTRGEA